jgi:hypothetical protein
MKIKNQLTMSRLIAKIDNDFNISESDWIPRVAAWTIDALAQLKCLPMQRKRRILDVTENIAYFPCQLNMKELKVFDESGCEIKPASEVNQCCDGSFKRAVSDKEIAVIDDTNKSGVNFMKVANIVNHEYRSFTVQGNCIEINFPADKIIVESYEVATYHDEYYDCECPYIYDDGLLLEALSWYVLFKYLSRGSQHPVYDLKSNSPVCNPYIQWNTLKPKAAASVKIAISNNTDGWNNFFYNSTFLPRG